MPHSLDEHVGVTPLKSPFIRPHLKNGAATRRAFLGSSTVRIWALFLTACIIYTLHRLSLDHSSTSHSFYNQDALHPINYLNVTSSKPSPFPFCPPHGPGDVIGSKYGAHRIAKSHVHLGSGARIQRVLHRAMSGQPITMSVLGSSISACHGCGDDPLAQNCWPTRFFMWWNSVFPNPATQITNGARRRTDSSYFAFCHSHHLPDETDLVIMDFDTEDRTDDQALEHFELLVRSILNRHDSPAIIILGHFAPQLQMSHGFNGPEFQHSVVAQYYDIPHISIKGPMYEEFLSDPDVYAHNYHVDPVLANPRGHELLSDILISYFQSQICRGWDVAMGQAYDVPVTSGQSNKATDAKGLFGGIRAGGEGMMNGANNDAGGHPAEKDSTTGGTSGGFKIPNGRIASRPWDLPNFKEARPFCVAADDLINPLPPSLFYGTGFHVYHPTGGDDNRHYWYSVLPTSKLRVPIKVTAGDVAVYILEEGKSPEQSSSIECWVDDNYGGRMRIQNSGTSGVHPKLIVIDHGVSTGPHFVECQLMGDDVGPVEPFKILGIFAT